jgi:hypothetical protein
MEKVEKGGRRMNNRMNKDVRNWLIVGTLIAVAILTTLWATSTSWFPHRPFEPRGPPGNLESIRYDMEIFYTVQTVVSTVNVTLAVFLLLSYIGIYQKTKSEFTIGLIVFSTVFLLNALASNPLLIRAFGYYPLGLGPFAMLPDLFTLLALAVLLYYSLKY